MKSSDSEARLRALRQWQRLLDSAFRIPGTNVRFGWDPIVGLIPWVGDVATAVFAGALIVQAARLGVPRVVQLRMLMNVAADVVIGLVPLLGDVADVFWKANSRNMAILERHAGPVRPSTIGDWVFVVSILIGLLVLAAIPFLLAYWLWNLLVS